MSDVPVGSIIAFAGPKSSIPAGWFICDGSSIARTMNQELFDAIGGLWGEGDGVHTFNLPDLRGMFLRGVTDSKDFDPDFDNRTPNAEGNRADAGSKQSDQFAAHHHPVSDPGHSHLAAKDLVNSGGPPFAFGAANFFPPTDRTSTEGTGISIGDSGGSETRPKNVYVNYIIKAKPL